jgi:plasmid maintenance system antidote protein VapI
MEIHTLSLTDLEDITGLSSEILNKMIHYEIDIPKETIPKLADRFKMREEAFMNQRIL